MVAIDLSEYNGIIDWGLAIPHIELAFVKAVGSSREDRIDPQFARNWKALKQSNQVLRGAYYYWCASDDIVGRAHKFLDVVQPGGEDLTAIDCEDMETNEAKRDKSSGALGQSIKTWLDEIEKETGKKSFIYTSPGWWIYWLCKVEKNQTIAPAWSGDYPLWLAHYTNAKAPMLPTGFSEWLIWQYGKESVPGCGVSSGSNPLTDVNRLAISVAQLRERWYGNPPAELTLEQKVAILWQAFQERT